MPLVFLFLSICKKSKTSSVEYALSPKKGPSLDAIEVKERDILSLKWCPFRAPNLLLRATSFSVTRRHIFRFILYLWYEAEICLPSHLRPLFKSEWFVMGADHHV